MDYASTATIGTAAPQRPHPLASLGFTMRALIHAVAPNICPLKFDSATEFLAAIQKISSYGSGVSLSVQAYYAEGN